MDVLNAMRTFVKVTEMHSFSAVAQQQAVPRSLISRQMAQLEAHLKVQLLTRSTRRLSLTSAGEKYLQASREILHRIDEAEQGLCSHQEQLQGPLRLSIPYSYGLGELLPLLMNFQKLHPDLILDLDFDDRRVNLIEEQADLALRITRHLKDTDVVRLLARMSAHVVASPDYWSRYGIPNEPADLLNHRGLIYSMGQRSGWTFITPHGEEIIPVPCVMLSNNGEALVEAARAGYGVTYQPEFLVRADLMSGKLQKVFSPDQFPTFGIYAVLPSHKHISQRVRVLMDYLTKSLQL